MRHTIYIMLTAVLGVMMDSCGYSSRTSRVLDSAESVMAVSPDSAYRILSSLPDPFPGDDGQYARYALLRTESEYKSGMCPSSDTLISVAVDYYSRRDPDSHDCMRSYYYQGRVGIYAEDYGDAIVSLLNSERAARRHSDHLILGLIYRGIADSYDALKDHQSAADYYRLSYEEFCKAPENIYADYALCDLARSNCNAFHYDEALELAKELYSVSVSKGDSTLFAASLSLIGKSSKKLNDKDTYHKCFLRLSSMDGRYLVPLDRLEIGLAYLETGNFEMAARFNDSVRKYIPDECYLSSRIHAGRHQFKEAYEMLQNELHGQNIAFSRYIRRNYSKIIDGYYSTRLEKTYNSLKEERTRKLFWIILTVLVIILCSVFLYHKNKIYRHKITGTLALASGLRTILQEKDEAITAQKRDIDQLNAHVDIKDREIEYKDRIITNQRSAISDARNMLDSVLGPQLDAIQRLCSSFYRHDTSRGHQSKVYNEVHDTLCSIKNNNLINENLERIINTAMDNLMNKFRTDFPHFRDEEYRLFIFLVLGFSTRAIAFLLDIDDTKVYSRKSYLKRKIKSSGSANTGDYLKYMS